MVTISLKLEQQNTDDYMVQSFVCHQYLVQVSKAFELKKISYWPIYGAPEINFEGKALLELKNEIDYIVANIESVTKTTPINEKVRQLFDYGDSTEPEFEGYREFNQVYLINWLAQLKEYCNQAMNSNAKLSFIAD